MRTSLSHRRNKTLQTNALLTLDPNVSGVFSGPYPFGIDPVSKCTQMLLSWHNWTHPRIICAETLFNMPSDLEHGGEPTVLPQLLQDEDVSCYRGHPHELWSGAECLQSPVSEKYLALLLISLHQCQACHNLTCRCIEKVREPPKSLVFHMTVPNPITIF